ncbi:MAG: ABC transporter substrate-binding protein [Microbacteriaceae bacterium]|nr:MAG: ABC transporter substrate-binding protein [Microbacteriaceae bacterium]
MNRKVRAGVTAAIAITASVAFAGCAGNDPLSSGGGATNAKSGGPVIIGSANFEESELIANIYSQELQHDGVKVKEQFNIGSREVTMKALEDGSLDLMPEYSSSVLLYLDEKAKATTRSDVITALTAKLPKGLSLLDVSQATDSDTVSVTQKTADEFHLTKISDLAPIGSQIALGGPPEWKTRYNGVVGLHDLYGITFQKFVTLDAGGPLTMTALTSGQVQAGDIFSTDPGIKKNNLVVLKDDKSLFADESVVPIIRTASVSDAVKKALNAVSAKLTTDDLITLNGQAATGANMADIAKKWLASKGLM